jgi:hypothetical protein
MEDTKSVYINQLDEQLPHRFLHHYATPGITPPSARVDPKLKIRPRRPLRIWDIWKYGFVVVSKGEFHPLLFRAPRFSPTGAATEVTGDVLLHHVLGPRRKSWGIEMTIVSSLMRGAGRHSTLVDIVSLALHTISTYPCSPFFSRLPSECS